MRKQMINVSWLAWLWFIITLIVAVAGLVNDFWSNNFQGDSLKMVAGVFDALTPLVFPLVGALIVSRQPKNTTGWLLMIPSLAVPLELFTRSEIYGVAAPPVQPSVSFVIAAYISNTIWIFPIFSIFFIALLFPTGRPLSPRWRWVAAYGIGIFAAFVIFAIFDKTISPNPSLYGVDWSIPNPLGLWDASPDESLFSILLVGMVVLTLLCVVSMILRYRRAAVVEREQIKWLLYAVSLFGAFYAIYMIFQTWGDDFWELFLGLFLAAIPLAIGIAILRYQLFDIDLIIRRTLQYTFLTGLLALIYFGIVVVGQNLVENLTGEQSPIVIVVSTLAIAAFFNPLRTRTQDFIDRRFYRQKYDAEQALAQFAAAARDEVDMEKLTGALLGVVEDTVQPERTSLWLKERREPKRYRG